MGIQAKRNLWEGYRLILLEQYNPTGFIVRYLDLAP